VFFPKNFEDCGRSSKIIKNNDLEKKKIFIFWEPKWPRNSSYRVLHIQAQCTLCLFTFGYVLTNTAVHFKYNKKKGRTALFSFLLRLIGLMVKGSVPVQLPAKVSLIPDHPWFPTHGCPGHSHLGLVIHAEAHVTLTSVTGIQGWELTAPR
jgi:hypothetical protein